MQPIKAVLTPVVAISEMLIKHNLADKLGQVLDVYQLACTEAPGIAFTDDIFLSWLDGVCRADDGDTYTIEHAWLDGALAAVVNSTNV